MPSSPQSILTSIIYLVATIIFLMIGLIAILLNINTIDTYFKTQKIAVELAEKAKADKITALKGYFEALPDLASVSSSLSPEKIILGKHLYFDTRLSKEGNNSCNSCHNLKTYGVDNLSFSPGDLGDVGGRNSPTTFNSGFHFVQFWDGRAKDVEEQAGGPILNPVEMNIPSKEFLVERLRAVAGYVKLFKKAFPAADTSLTYWNIQQAIGAFERTLITPSKFDLFLQGKVELESHELQGLESFVNVGCTQCHSGMLLGGNTFQKFGVHANYWEATRGKKVDFGRFDFTSQESDKYIFKVPSLRNIAKTHPYFHDGSIANLEDAVKIMAKVQLNKELKDKEVSNIVSFLQTLTGELSPEQQAAPQQVL